ncbi:MAG: Regulator of polyketide synthase expression [uncultured Pseudonocardia sp.]|uniref:Regulator of polyketide synthase expression n=1 Tax=uncultured Pseudonocardia sp. TaxID=211455 RepID=A0A6J4Q3Y4_9PSEU|nr:MAG: Regulator of polyketide synthase expression [uncultured Pseudonocardia sp.]
MAGALQEARHACARAAAIDERVAVVAAAEVTSHVGLLAAVPEDVRRAFAERVLGPLLAHDARAGTGLLPTVAAFLDCDGSWTRAAARLHLHVNSVRYRIARVEELTGRDLSTLGDRVDLLLALAVRGR